jgi:hypothetical protein
MKVKRTERGWPGHFCCAFRCEFRRNTLLEYEDVKIVVSTVGIMRMDNETINTVGLGRYYETMAFHSDLSDTRFYDVDVSKEVYFDAISAIDHIDADDEANIMHENVVKEISERLEKGEKFEVEDF